MFQQGSSQDKHFSRYDLMNFIEMKQGQAHIRNAFFGRPCSIAEKEFYYLSRL